MDNIITGWKRYVLVQPSLMLLIFAQAISNLIIYRVCKITLDINETECLLLHINSSCATALQIDAQVQPEASLVLMMKTFIENIFPAFLSLFLGPWSDKHGRKAIIVLGYIGPSLTYFILSFMTFWDISPWFLLIAYIPTACFGGFCIILLGTICYISDITNEQDRAWQLAWMEVLIFVGVIAGILVGPVVFQAYGYTIVFGCASLCCILAGLYIYLLVPDSICSRNLITLNSIFDVHLVKELISTCTKKRDGFNRYIVWCCLTVIILFVIVLQGEMTIGFLFASAKLGWDVNIYSIYVAVNITFTTFGVIFGVKVLTTYTRISEETAAILSVLSSLSRSLVQSLTWKSWHMYLSAAVGAFSGVASPMLRSIISKSVPPEDTGKIFSLLVCIETLTPLVAASLYGLMYSHFMPPVYPVPVWLVSVGIYIIVILVLINIRIKNRRCNILRYTPLVQDSELLS
ncbi:proton-coupled folate transporter-like isoform X2 [Hylaeus anthracinus]|uniref:proton-coupled folate transporter-like isoform X2 n=1 Tax=Hylaeus anthracinus TaxID=313031 RepID=UPI0023B8CCDB|nr:proton-coupled folate transporter-like isoform X2 [Hylaeus anthracinus]